MQPSDDAVHVPEMGPLYCSKELVAQILKKKQINEMKYFILLEKNMRLSPELTCIMYKISNQHLLYLSPSNIYM